MWVVSANKIKENSTHREQDPYFVPWVPGSKYLSSDFLHNFLSVHFLDSLFLSSSFLMSFITISFYFLPSISIFLCSLASITICFCSMPSINISNIVIINSSTVVSYRHIRYKNTRTLKSYHLKLTNKKGLFNSSIPLSFDLWTNTK